MDYQECVETVPLVQPKGKFLINCCHTVLENKKVFFWGGLKMAYS